jgi:hypothetical protein
MTHFNRPAGPSLPAFIQYSLPAQAIPDGQASSLNILTSRQRLMWDLIGAVSKQYSLAPSEVLRQASIGELDVNLPSEFLPLLRAEFQKKALNPMFGAWLMGWPSTWVIAEPHASSASETESWRSALQQHLSCLLDERDCSTSRMSARL